MLDTKVAYTPAELCDEYRMVGCEPPGWLLRKAGLATLAGPELTAKAM